MYCLHNIYKAYFNQKNKLTQDQLDFIDATIDRAISYAEILHKNDPSVDKKKVAIDYAFEIVKEAKIVPDQYINIIKTIIEDKILNR